MVREILNCLVVDDEKLARELLADLISRHVDLNLVAGCRNIRDAKDSLKNHRVDIIFLDIQMPGTTGIEFLRQEDVEAKVIFTTAYKDYAVEGFELEATDYLLKPITEDKFQISVNKARKLFELESKAQAFEKIEASNQAYIHIRSGYDDYKLYHHEITYIESDGEYAWFYTVNSKYLVLTALKKLEEELPSEKFTRIHRKYIIRRDLIKGREGNNIILMDNTSFPVGKTYRKKVFGQDLFNS